MGGDEGQTGRSRRRLWVVASVVIVMLASAAAAFVLMQESTSQMCTLAGVISESTSNTPEEAARRFAEDADGPGALDDPGGFQRQNQTEWRKDLGGGSYRRLMVEEVPGGGWRVVDFNTCSEWKG